MVLMMIIPALLGGQGTAANYQVLGATRQVLQAGTPEQVKAAQEVLRDARKSLYKILADD